MGIDKNKLLSDLSRLIDHPDTPASERENALMRVREIELRLSKAMVANRKKPGLSSLSKRSSLRVRYIKEPWPFGWTGDRGRVDYNFAPQGSGGMLTWACPDCGRSVVEDIQGMLLRRLLIYPKGVWMRLRDRSNGKLNQLCNACWDKYED